MDKSAFLTVENLVIFHSIYPVARSIFVLALSLSHTHTFYLALSDRSICNICSTHKMYLYKITCHNQRFYCIQLYNGPLPQNFIRTHTHRHTRAHSHICMNFCWKCSSAYYSLYFSRWYVCLLAWWLLSLKFLSLYLSRTHTHTYTPCLYSYSFSALIIILTLFFFLALYSFKYYFIWVHL